MAFNKRPLALRYDDTTGNADGLIEFTLNLSDVGDVCSGTVPTTDQVLAWTGSEACWSSIVFPAGGGGGSTFTCSDLSSCNLSSLGDVCSATPETGQVLAYSGTNGFCYSSINFPVSRVNGNTGDVALTLDEINAATNTSFAANGTLTVAGSDNFTVAGDSGDVTVGDVTVIRGADGDIEAGKDVVIGQNSFTQTSAKIANVEENSLMITDSASAVSSVSGASGTIPYFSGTNPKPVLTGIPTIMQEAGVRVEDKTLADLSDAQYSGGTPTNGQALIWQGDFAPYWQNQTVKSLVGNVQANQESNGTTIIKNVPSVPVGKTGEGDITANTILYFSGTNASSTDTLTLSTDGRNLIESGSATNVQAFELTANSATISNLNVTRTGQMNPTVYIQEADWLTPGGAANGFGTTQSGSNAGFGQCFDNDIMHPDKGTIGVYEIRSGTDGYGRAFLTTFNNALAVSSCAISFTSRIAPSGLWENGVNEGKMCFGLRNGTGNSAATYAMEFQYGQGGGGTTTTWSAVVTDNSNSTVSDTGVVVSAQEFQVLQVSCNENWDTVDFYVDGVNKAQFSLAAGHNIPDSRFNRLGLAWAINNANIYSTSNNTVGNEIFLDWHQIRMTHNNTTRGKDLIQ